jgi:hypothetical protein
LDLLFLHSIPYMRIDGFQIKERKKRNHCAICKRLSTTIFKWLFSVFWSKQIRNPDDETQCSACPLGTLPNVERSQCLTIPEVYLRPDSGWAIGAMSFSAVGIALTFTVQTFHYLIELN